jgi:hypothetical protein
MYDDVRWPSVQFGSEISLNDTNEYQHSVLILLILNGKRCEDIK